MNKQVSGIVEAKGDKFNGSVKVMGQWLNFKKGTLHDNLKVGDNAVLELESWEFKGKTGFSIVSFTVKDLMPAKAPAKLPEAPVAATVAPTASPVAYVGRDFDAENRGKVRHGLTVALVPLLATDSITLEKLKDTVSSVVDFVMKGS